MANWNPNKTRIVIQFDDFPLRKPFKIKLLSWFEILKNNTEQTNPICLEGEILDELTLPSTKKLYKGTVVYLSVWSGIYSKWESAVKIKPLETNRPVVATFYKTNKRKWEILELKQEQK
jgi:hypothetical protein